MAITPIRPGQPTAGYRMVARGDRGEIYLYGLVGDGWFGGVTATQFAADLKALGAVKTIDLRINSEGGDVFQGRTIYSLLSQHSARIVVHVDGLAASMASLIAMAGDEIRMAEGSFMMIHNAWTIAAGDATELRRTADLLETVSDSMVATYTKRSGQPDKTVRKMMDAETWMTAEEAVAQGFANLVAEPVRVAAAVRDPARYRRTPSALIRRPARDALAAKVAASSAQGTRGVR